MTEENKILRDKLKAIEGIITNALTHQPEDDTECKKHLETAMAEVTKMVPHLGYAVNMREALEMFLEDIGGYVTDGLVSIMTQIRGETIRKAKEALNV